MQHKSWGGPGSLPAILLGLGILGPGIAALPAVAGQTRIWTQSEYADFEKGIMKDVSLRSDGLLT